MSEKCKHLSPPNDRPRRQMKCAMCNHTEDSNPNAPFFENMNVKGGSGGKSCANCHMHEVAHGRSDIACDNFVLHEPWAYDAFYCGCRGWD